MAAALNGMALCGVRPYGATFFVFSDYLRPSLRLSALMHLPTLLVFTHDSIGVGEDGPTHQPVEQLAAARSIPGLIVLRPADANETAQAWHVALRQTDRPVALVLTRQNLPTLDRSQYATADGVQRGAYVLADAAGDNPEVILLATGSEVSLAVEAYRQLEAEGIARGWSACLHSNCSKSSRRLIVTMCCHHRSPRGWRLRQGFARVGTTTWDPRAPLSACTALAGRRRSKKFTRTRGSWPGMSSPKPRGWWARMFLTTFRPPGV